MKTLSIKITEEKSVIVQPVPRAELAAFTDHMAEIQAIWIEEGFSTGDAIARNDCWDHMQSVAKMLPHHDMPAIRGIELEKLSNDYAQLEQLFFGDAKDAYDPAYVNQGAALNNFTLTAFQGCTLYDLHRFEPKKKLVQAYGLYQEKNQTAPSRPKTSPSRAAMMPKPMRSPISSTGSVRKTA